MTELLINAFIQIRIWDILDIFLVGLLFYGLYCLVKGTCIFSPTSSFAVLLPVSSVDGLALCLLLFPDLLPGKEPMAEGRRQPCRGKGGGTIGGGGKERERRITTTLDNPLAGLPA